jgi:hypothetical protein
LLQFQANNMHAWAIVQILSYVQQGNRGGEVMNAEMLCEIIPPLSIAIMVILIVCGINSQD